MHWSDRDILLTVVGRAPLDTRRAICPGQAQLGVVGTRVVVWLEIESFYFAFLCLERALKVVACVVSEVGSAESANTVTADIVIAILTSLVLKLRKTAVVQVQVEDLLVVGHCFLLAPAPILFCGNDRAIRVAGHEIRACQALLAIVVSCDLIS